MVSMIPRRPLLAGMAGLGLAGTARAADYPNQPLRIVVSFAPGGEPDILARKLAQVMERSLGTSVVVDNRPGANTLIAANHVAQSRPDGYTVLLTSSTTFAVVPHLYETQRISLNQFAPLSLVMRAQMALYCNPRLPVQSVSELVEYARKQRQPMLYAANQGAIAHLCGELLQQQTGIKLSDVSYRGTTGAQQLLLRGDVPFGFDGVPAYIEMVKGKELRGLGVTGDKRVPVMPDVPTFAETGFPDIAVPYWYGLFAPAGTPRPIVDRLVAALHEAQQDRAATAQFIAQGAELLGNDPETFATMITTEREKWGQLIRRIGLRLD